MKAKQFTGEQRRVIRWAAEECKRQRSGELSVAWMLDAWEYALAFRLRSPAERDILNLAGCVEPEVNANGYRRCGVRVGSDVKGPWEQVPRQVAQLVAAVDTLTPDEWYREYESVHPFRDGNGRTGTILFNWLRGSLGDPIHPPDWDDPIGYWGIQDDYALIRAAEAGWSAYRGERQGKRRE